MQVRALITNFGIHSPAKWAELSCAEIISIPKDSQSPDAEVGRRLEIKFLDILEAYHTHVQAAEEAQLDEDGDGRLESPLDGQEHDPEEVVVAIAAASKGTPFEDYFAKPDIQQNIRNVLNHHKTSSMAVSRGTRADKMDTPAAKAWLHARDNAPGGVINAHYAAQRASQSARTVAKK